MYGYSQVEWIEQYHTIIEQSRSGQPVVNALLLNITILEGANVASEMCYW